MSTRGDHLLRGGLLFAIGSGVVGRLFARSFGYGFFGLGLVLLALIVYALTSRLAH